MARHAFWQSIEPAGTYEAAGPFTQFYPATLPDGHQVRLPIRVLPGDGTRGVAGLMAERAWQRCFPPWRHSREGGNLCLISSGAIGRNGDLRLRGDDLLKES